MVEADKRSRWADKYDVRTPPSVFAAADRMARRLWGRGVSFDRMASHLNAMPPPGMGKTLPFNSFWSQPGSAGVDMFVQPLSSWAEHINFIHPPRPLLGRVVTFLQATRSRCTLVIPDGTHRGAWWSSWVSCGGPGVRCTCVVEGYLLVALDHR